MIQWRDGWRRKACWAALAVVSCAGVFVWWSRTFKVLRPVVWVRHAGGRSSWDELMASSYMPGYLIDWPNGSTTGKPRITASASASQHGLPLLATRHLQIHCLSEHPVAHACGGMLFHHLTNDSRFERCEYYPLGTRPKDGSEIADAIVILRLRIDQEPGLLGGEFRATVDLSMKSPLPVAWPAADAPGFAALCRMAVDVRLDIEAKIEGFAAPMYRFVGAITRAAWDGGDTLVSELDRLSRSSSPLPELPSEFEPAWTASVATETARAPSLRPTWSFLDGAVCLYNQRGFDDESRLAMVAEISGTSRGGT